MTEIVNKLAVFKDFDSKLALYKKEYETRVYDLNDPEQMEAAKTDKKEVAKVIRELDDTHKTAKADLLSETRLLDGERKRIKDVLIKVKDNAGNQLEAHANKAVIHAAMLNDKVESINKLAEFDIETTITIELVQERLDLANNSVIDDSFESREADGHMAKAKTIELLQGKFMVMEKAATEEAEAEAARVKAQKEFEEQIRKDAAAKADKEKLAAEARAKKAEEDKKAAGIKAKKDAEIAKKKAEEDKKAAIKAEQEKAEKAAQEKELEARKEVERLQAIADEEAKVLKAKQENQSHRAKIHKAIKDELRTAQLAADDDHAIKIVKLLISSKNVTINY